MTTIRIRFEGQERQVPAGIRLDELAQQIGPRPRPLLAARVNHELQELDYSLLTDSDIEWIDHNSTLGHRIFQRGAIFLLDCVARRLFPGRRLRVSHSLTDGLFCLLDQADGLHITPLEVSQLEAALQELVAESQPIHKTYLTCADAAAYFQARGDLECAACLLSSAESLGHVPIYSLGEYQNYLHGEMPLNSGLLTGISLTPFEDGFLLILPLRYYLDCRQREEYPPLQLQATLNENDEWGHLLGVSCVADLNQLIDDGGFRDLVLIAETLQERNLHDISDRIFSSFPQVRLLLVAGPSSSGKTTTTQRLAIHFRTLGLHTQTLSLDDYFINRDQVPLNEWGKPDFESIHTLDLPLFNEQLQALLAGKEVITPRFDFLSGRRCQEGVPMRLEDQQIIIVEGIHALNEQLSASISPRHKRKLFVSALTQLNIDPLTPISTSDVRLLRRIVRDQQFRGYSAEQTIDTWDNVRRGEHKNIFPYQEQADYFFNSTLIYELPVLRNRVEAALSQITLDSPSYLIAQRLLKFIRYFRPAPDESIIPRTSLLQEFLGQSIFDTTEAASAQAAPTEQR